MFATTAARILTICPFMGIEVSPECESVIPDVEDALNDEILEFRIDPESFTFDPDLFKEAGEEAREKRKTSFRAQQKRVIIFILQFISGFRRSPVGDRIFALLYIFMRVFL